MNGAGYKNIEVEDTKTHVIYRRETIGDLYKERDSESR
jgi:hypothetical protein